MLIVSRFENLTTQLRALEARGVRAITLMRQPQYSARRTDHRQVRASPIALALALALAPALALALALTLALTLTLTLTLALTRSCPPPWPPTLADTLCCSPSPPTAG